jgi:hypothetical protein
MRALLIACLLALSGCQQVAPWERDILARSDMATEPLTLEAARNQHLQQSREAGSTATTAAGGGCGCY